MEAGNAWQMMAQRAAKEAEDCRQRKVTKAEDDRSQRTTRCGWVRQCTATDAKAGRQRRPDCIARRGHITAKASSLFETMFHVAFLKTCV